MSGIVPMLKRVILATLAIQGNAAQLRGNAASDQGRNDSNTDMKQLLTRFARQASPFTAGKDSAAQGIAPLCCHPGRVK